MAAAVLLQAAPANVCFKKPSWAGLALGYYSLLPHWLLPRNKNKLFSPFFGVAYKPKDIEICFHVYRNEMKVILQLLHSESVQATSIHREGFL